MKKPALLCILIMTATLAHAQSVRYVTDQLRLEARTGPSTSHRITRMLESGTQVTVLEESEGYSRIQLGNDTDAWILTRYLSPEPPARDQVAKAKKELQATLEENAQMKAALEEARSTGSKTQQERIKLDQDNTRLSKELAQIRRTAASTLSIEQQNQELQIKVVNLERELQIAQQENMSLSDNSDRDWFVTGAGVLFGGIILGLTIPRMRWKKKSRGWGEL
jgi:SH3 domain protein